MNDWNTSDPVQRMTSVEGLEEASDGDLVENSVFVSILGGIFLVASALNPLFLAIYYRRHALRSISNRFIVNLTVSNLLACWCLSPLIGIDILTPAWISTMPCVVLEVLINLIESASIFATSLIAVDRFFAVTDPLHYHMLITTSRSVLLIAIGWIAAIGVSGFSAIGVNQPTRPLTSCILEPRHFNPYITLVKLTISFVVPMNVIIWCYARIYKAAQQNSERARRSSLCGSAVDGASKGSSRTPSTRSTSSHIVTSLRHKISNASVFMHKEEARAAWVSALVIFLFFLCWLPYYTIDLLRSTFIQVQLPSWSIKLTFVFALSNTAISPYLYLFRSRRIKKEVRRLFGLPINPGNRLNRRKFVLPGHLEAIPPSPTVPEGNFDAIIDMKYAGSNDPKDVSSPVAIMINKLFRSQDVSIDTGTRDSITSGSSASTHSTCFSSGCECHQAEYDSMLNFRASQDLDTLNELCEDSGGVESKCSFVQTKLLIEQC